MFPTWHSQHFCGNHLQIFFTLSLFITIALLSFL